MVLNTAARMLRDAEELKEKILKFKSGTSMLQERNLWSTQQQLQNIYQKLLVYDLDYALNKKVEQDLWNIGFKQQIDALQAISKDRKNALRSEGQAMLSWVLQAAAGFYLCLLHQICTTFRLDLPFRRRASLLGWVEGWGATPYEGTPGAKLPPPAAARYICQHCLVHLGDLARYRQQLRIAHTFYRHALLVSAHSGQPYNQLALVAWRRARPLSALYWHVRSFLVKSPFPPAPANLARTLAAAAASATQKAREPDLPVLPGVTKKTTEASAPPTPARLDAHTYIGEFIRVLHMIHTLDESDSVNQLVNTLNSSLTALVATDSFESMSLIKMACVCIWLAHWSTEGHTVGAEALSESEQAAERAAMSLCVGVILALLLPAYTRNEPPPKVLPSLKVWLHWLCARRTSLSHAALASRPQLWPALAHTLNSLVDTARQLQPDLYETLPLPEDEELHGFLPLENAFASLKFSNYATWDTYGDRIPDVRPNNEAVNGTDNVQADIQADSIRAPYEVNEESLRAEPELERRLRAHRLVRLGAQLAALVAESGGDYFTVSTNGGELLSRALAELSATAGAAPADDGDAEPDSEDEPASTSPHRPGAALTQPLIISEADFRQHVREKRVGILKPQGSLERAREERALANNAQQEAEEEGDESSKSEEARREAARRPRMNVAMAAIMRKQEESNKQVKFVTPATTPDSTADPGETAAKEPEKPKVIQPKAVKSLANLPTGRKTGGILSLKDKSAGYPHLVNAEPDTSKSRNEKEDKKESPKQSAGQGSKLRQENHPTSPVRAPNSAAPNAAAVSGTHSESGRLNLLHKNSYGTQNQLNFNYSNANGQGIKLAVVNPKEIDVRSAALQKQNSRYELFHDGQKLNQNSQFSSDKKNFLNDLPPRFANQYRYWQQANESHFNQENKFKDDSYMNVNPFSTLPQNSHLNWPIPQEPYQQQQQQQQHSGWWKPENNSFNMKYSLSTPPPMNLQQNYYSNNLNPNIGNAYQSSPYTMLNQPGLSLQKPEIGNAQNYIQAPNTQPLHSIGTSPSFSTPLNSFGNYSQAVGYDTNLYSQYGNNKFNYPSQLEKPLGQIQNNDFLDTRQMNYGGILSDIQPPNPTYADPINNDRNAMKSLDQIGRGGAAVGSTYSLFSGAPEQSAWASTSNAQQSLWSGPNLSPLERLLAQQKQLKQPNDN